MSEPDEALLLLLSLTRQEVDKLAVDLSEPVPVLVLDRVASGGDERLSFLLVVHPRRVLGQPCEGAHEEVRSPPQDGPPDASEFRGLLPNPSRVVRGEEGGFLRDNGTGKAALLVIAVRVDYTEAQLFMDNITSYLNLPEDAKILDLACGKGRHSMYLNKLGFDVTGADLSENSIKEAAESANETLHFTVHDMREPFEEKFDAIFNLFTSFGYFDNDADNLKTLIAIRESLTEYGFAVIDFMNADQVIKNLVP